MTIPENAEMRQLALKVLRQHAGPAAGGEAIAAAAQRAFDDLARVSVPLIGQVGLEALAGRAVHLAQREHQWLVCTREPEQPKELFAQVAFCIERQEPAVATEGAGALFAALTGLLVMFIGEPLTTRVLRQAWPSAFSNVTTEEVSQ